MSKRVEAKVRCPSCGVSKQMSLYRSLWVEYPENLALVESDTLNLFECSRCGWRQQLPFAVLCTNVKRSIAIWYEPHPDPAVDKDIVQYTRQFGPNHFFARAPRIADWNEFKRRLSGLLNESTRHERISIEAEDSPGPEDLEKELAEPDDLWEPGPGEQGHRDKHVLPKPVKRRVEMSAKEKAEQKRILDGVRRANAGLSSPSGRKSLWQTCRPDLVTTDFVMAAAVSVAVAILAGMYTRSITAALVAAGAIIALAGLLVLIFMFADAAGWFGSRVGELAYDSAMAVAGSCKNMVTPAQGISTVIASVMLLLALGDQDYEFYELLRVICCPTFAYHTWLAMSRRSPEWAFVFGFGTLLYNPFASPDFEKSVWSIVNILSIVALAVFALRTRKGAKRPSARSS